MRVGHAEDASALSGTTAILFDSPVIAAADIRGGGPGTRDTTLLDLENTVDRIDGFFLSGGSAFGLDAGGGVQAFLADNGRGYPVGTTRVPIVPGAILFDLLNGGEKGNGTAIDYRTLGKTAASAASDDATLLGSVGAGLGATTANLRGGLGTASAHTASGQLVAALAAVNAVGSATIGDSPHFWAAPFEQGDEFGGHGWPQTIPDAALLPATKGGPGQATTLCVIATDADLTPTEAKRLAIMAQDGMARAVMPVHSPLDGDIVFAAATGATRLAEADQRALALMQLGAQAAHCVARAIARGVFAASPSTGSPNMPPAYSTRFA